jgi:hypothetical protein
MHDLSNVALHFRSFAREGPVSCLRIESTLTNTIALMATMHCSHQSSADFFA